MIEHMSLAQRLLPALLLPLATPSYVPPYYEGVPAEAGVTALDPPDFRGTPVYRVEFSLSVQAAGRDQNLNQVASLATLGQVRMRSSSALWCECGLLKVERYGYDFDYYVFSGLLDHIVII